MSGRSAGPRQQRFDELVEVVNLLQLAAGVLVEPAVPGQDMKFLEQFDRLPGRISGMAGSFPIFS